MNTVQRAIRQIEQTCGSLKGAARALGVDSGNLNKVKHGKLEPTPAICAALGYERHVIYRRTGKVKAKAHTTSTVNHNQ